METTLRFQEIFDISVLATVVTPSLPLVKPVQSWWISLVASIALMVKLPKAHRIFELVLSENFGSPEQSHGIHGI